MTSKTKRVAITAVSAATFYGGWAFFANKGTSNVWTSTLVQFVLSLFFGMTLALLVEFVFERLKKPLRFFVAAFVPYWSALVLFYIAHYLAGTQHILLTLAPNAIVGTLYFVVYVKKLEAIKK